MPRRYASFWRFYVDEECVLLSMINTDFTAKPTSHIMIWTLFASDAPNECCCVQLCVCTASGDDVLFPCIRIKRCRPKSATRAFDDFRVSLQSESEKTGASPTLAKTKFGQHHILVFEGRVGGRFGWEVVRVGSPKEEGLRRERAPDDGPRREKGRTQKHEAPKGRTPNGGACQEGPVRRGPQVGPERERHRVDTISLSSSNMFSGSGL